MEGYKWLPIHMSREMRQSSLRCESIVTHISRKNTREWNGEVDKGKGKWDSEGGGKGEINY